MPDTPRPERKRWRRVGEDFTAARKKWPGRFSIFAVGKSSRFHREIFIDFHPKRYLHRDWSPLSKFGEKIFLNKSFHISEVSVVNRCYFTSVHSIFFDVLTKHRD